MLVTFCSLSFFIRSRWYNFLSFPEPGQDQGLDENQLEGNLARGVQGVGRQARGSTAMAWLRPPLPMSLAVFEYFQNLLALRFPHDELSSHCLSTHYVRQQAEPWFFSVLPLGWPIAKCCLSSRLGQDWWGFFWERTWGLPGYTKGMANTSRIYVLLGSPLPNLPHHPRCGIWAAPNSKLKHSLA